MGGNAFKKLPIERIKRENINVTLEYIADALNSKPYKDHLIPPAISKEYMQNNLLGSAGKQADSGDLDIVLDEKYFPKQALHNIANKMREDYGDDYVNTKTLRGNQIQTAWQIIDQSGLVQVDFILGIPEWIKFTHWSPGFDRSPYKGVFVSQCLGVIAKMKVDYVYPVGAIMNEKRWEISWAYDLERGLRRRWRCRKQPDQNMSEVSPEWFETHCPEVPHRFGRTDFITNPYDATRILLGKSARPEHIETFEDLWALLKRTRTEEYMAHLEPRFHVAFLHSGGKRDYSTIEEIKALEVFQ